MSKNILYYGDNLDILRHHIADQSVDLIYLDPPFNSNRSYNVLFRESDGTAAPAQIRAFEDSWTWDRKAAETLEELAQTAPTSLVNLLNAFVPFLGHSPMMAYLVMMAIRLVELRRVLKPTGSIYLHCDPTASHYLKIVMDGIFGPRNYRNEIVWQKIRTEKAQSKQFARLQDVILYYSKSDIYTFNQQRAAPSKEYISKYYTAVEKHTGRRYQLVSFLQGGDGPLRRFGDRVIPPPSGKHWIWSQDRIDKAMEQGRLVFTSPDKPRLKRYLDEYKGRNIGSIWTDIYPINAVAKERLGYPTQKPLALLERVIKASSNEGDLVLDPFCGCGTTVDAAQHLGRRWIGIDITHIAISLIRRRLRDRYGQAIEFEVVGEPKDEGSARVLAQQDRHQFQSWALDQIDARPAQEVKGSDRGIDGVRFFSDDGKTIRRVLVQVKSGHVGVALIRDMVGTLNRENDDKERAPIGIFVTLEQPTQPMIREAASARFYRHPLIPDKKFPRIQILSVRDLFDGRKPDLPHSQPLTYTKAGTAPKMKTQEKLNL